MKIATWNVNSVRKRTSNLIEWLKSAKPDVAVLQEIKAQEAQFPRLEVEAAGYKGEIVGQKSWNGVALLSLHPVEITARSLPDPETDEQARYIEGKVQTPQGPLTVGGLYLPNGNPIHTDKFAYKIAWMDRLAQRGPLPLEPSALRHEVMPQSRGIPVRRRLSQHRRKFACRHQISGRRQEFQPLDGAVEPEPR